jgi:hypothetical protein
MEETAIHHEPEALVYLARHYSYIGAANQAIAMFRRAAVEGFVCAPAALRSDGWLRPVRAHPEFEALATDAEKRVAASRSLAGDLRLGRD